MVVADICNIYWLKVAYSIAETSPYDIFSVGAALNRIKNIVLTYFIQNPNIYFFKLISIIDNKLLVAIVVI
jgi:hypothetical protein